MRRLMICAVCFGLALPLAAQEVTPVTHGSYTLDLGHTRILFRVSHLGFSNYTALFTKAEATLDFDPAHPEAARLSASIDAASVETHYPDPAVDFNAVIAGPELLDAATYPAITFVSTKVVVTGKNSADVTGDFTLRGITKPVTLGVTYNGGYGSMSMDPAGARIGFSATGTINRSEFGMGFGVPAPGTTMGVGDAVSIIIEAELTKPATP